MILDFKVFTVNNDVFVAFIEQGYTAWANARVKVFEITKRSMMELSPEDDGYDKFCLFSGDEIAPTTIIVGEILQSIRKPLLQDMISILHLLLLAMIQTSQESECIR